MVAKPESSGQVAPTYIVNFSPSYTQTGTAARDAKGKPQPAEWPPNSTTGVSGGTGTRLQRNLRVRPQVTPLNNSTFPGAEQAKKEIPGPKTSKVELGKRKIYFEKKFCL
ncbi:hypothetical protein ACNR90_000673 [Candidozyma auris]|nr:hypothetical protein QG37_01240 [[Candida] auris]